MDNVKLGQIFSVDGTFSPSKVSVYLKPVNTSTNSNSFDVSMQQPSGFWGASIDSLNFLEIFQGNNKIMPKEDTSDYTGNGYLETLSSCSSNSCAISYPVFASDNHGPYNVWLRVRSIGEVFNGEVYLGDLLVDNIIEENTNADWHWVSMTISLTTTDIKMIKIKLLNKGNAIDKIYIVPLAYGSTPTGKGFDFTDAPFITVHSQVHKLDVNNYPTKLLCVYSSLNTFRDIILDDWYNFNLSFLSGELEEVWSGDYAVVLFSSGSNKNRYVMWDTFPNDEYVHEPSIIKIKEN